MTLPAFFENVAWSVRFQDDATVLELDVRAAAEAFRPIVRITPDAAQRCAQGALLLVNMLARTYGTIGIDAPTPLVTELRQAARSINPAVSFATPADGTVVAFGDTGGAALYVGGHRWTAAISRAHPVACDPYPISAMVAAALAAGELFRMAFAGLLPDSWELSGDVAWSLLEHVLDGSGAEGPEWPGEVRLGNVYVVGLGAVANAALFALRACDRLTGTLHLIDNQNVELSNLQRYVLADAEDATRHRTKVNVAQRWIKRPGLGVRPHVETWEKFMATWAGPWRFERVLTSPDSVAARQAVQAALPREVINAGVGRSVLDVGRYTFDGTHECLACAYARTPSPPMFELMRETFGLSPTRLQELEDGNVGLAPEDIAVIEAHVHRPGELGYLLGQSPRSAYMRMCGFVGPETAATNEAALVPAAHVPVLAGLLLAVELLKSCVPDLRDFALRYFMQLDARYALAPESRLLQPNPAGDGCTCRDARYRAAFEDKWGAPLL